MEQFTDLLDDDDRIALTRYQPLNHRGVDRILAKLKHLVTPTPDQIVWLRVPLPVDVANWMAGAPDYDDLGNVGVALNAIGRAARTEDWVR